MDGDHVGLYHVCDKMALSETINNAEEIITQTLEECRDEDNPQEEVDSRLEALGIYRVLADEAYTDVI